MHDASLWKLFKAVPRGLAFLIVGIGEFLSAQWRQYTPFGQMLWILAVIAIGIDAGISYEFGSTLSYLHAAGFGLVALAFCILPDVAAMEFRKGQKTTAAWIGVACVPLGLVALLTHVGYSASIRVGDMQQSDVSNAKYEDTRTSVQEAKDRIKQFSDRIAELKAANPWVTSVSADGLKAQAETVAEAIAQESRRGGCGPKCLALKEKQSNLLDQASKAEELASHEKMLAGAQAGLDKAKARAADATYVSSTAVNHTDTLYKALSLVRLQPVDNVTMTEREATNTGIMGMSSIAFLLLAPLFYFAAGLNRRPGVLDAWIYGKEEPADRGTAIKPNVSLNGMASALPAPAHTHKHITITDEASIAKLRKQLMSNAEKAHAKLMGNDVGVFA